MTVTSFRTLVEAQYVPYNAQKQMRAQFRELGQGGPSMQAYVQKFMELAMFAPGDVASMLSELADSGRGLKGDIRLLCRTPKLMLYSELLDMSLGVEDDKTSTWKSSATSRGVFYGRGVFQHRGMMEWCHTTKTFRGRLAGPSWWIQKRPKRGWLWRRFIAGKLWLTCYCNAAIVGSYPDLTVTPTVSSHITKSSAG